MKTKHILLVIIGLLIGGNAEAQILKKLKKRAEQAAERTILRKTDEIVSKKTEKTIDDATTSNDRSNTKSDGSADDQIDSESTNSALTMNTAYKKEFYKEDAIIKTYENGNLNQTQYFDADQVAVRMESDAIPKPGYLDSEAYMYSYNDNEQAYNKSAILASGGQGMMVPNMMLEILKLPPEPALANTQKQMDKGITPNPFNGFVEFAFIYGPEQFRYEDFKEVKQNLRGKSYTKFEFLNEPGYEGSYVIFDDEDRLIEIYTNKADTGQSMDAFDMSMMPPGESLIVYEYKPVEVNLPPAKEVRTRGQDMMGLVMGSFKKDKDPEDIDEDDYDTSDSKGMTKSVKKSLKNHKVKAADLPKSYDFDYLYKTTMVSNSKKKGTDMDIIFLINSKNGSFSGSEYIVKDLKDKGTMTMVFDSNLNIMAMFIKGQANQNMLQITPIPDVRNEAKINYEIKELPPKTILGYTCSGLQLEDDKYIMTVYHAKDAPISLINFFGGGGSNATKNIELPDMDPRVLEQFENGLVMEMQYEDKKKSKNNFTVTAISLEKVSTEIKIEDYRFLDMFSGTSMFKN
ncbi:hypothetical protein [Winogradskyella thalassocola]|uniref:DUF4412 domain-containing protein n=1 Tax=Winogradskyella thalassocola TaxID=262004 RepID=A0A1G8HQ26_9FLAO|nr:hypothetical protein [Winogradskyella thalassocola]SDI08590.1 hypothetical protein SAMN04489796_1079 [Winogradskyella thalassocola]